MDVDVISRNEVLVLPDAYVSEPDIESDDSREEAIISAPDSDDSSDGDDGVDTTATTKKPKHHKAIWRVPRLSDQQSKLSAFTGDKNVFEESLKGPTYNFQQHWTNAMTEPVVRESIFFATQN